MVAPAVLMVLLLGISFTYRNFTLDDPFITFRFARNLLAGLGPVWNPGERVEGFTSPFWLVVSAAILRAVGAQSESAILGAKVVGAAFGVVALLGCWRLAQALHPAQALWSGLAAGAILALTVYFPAWIVGGLETPAFCAGLVWLAVWLSTDSLPSWRAMVLLGLLPWIRPEGLAVAAVVVGSSALIALRSRTLASSVAPLAVPCVSIALLFLVRWSYYGELLPNTYYAKSSQGLTNTLAAGMRYVWTWLIGPGAALWIVALGGAIAAGLSRRPLVVSSGLAITLLLATVWEGGDWMPGYRFIVPALPLLAAIAGATVAVAGARVLGQRSVGWGAWLLLLGAAAVILGAPGVAARDMRLVLPNVGPGQPGDLAPARYVSFGRWMQTHVPPEAVVAIGEAGIIPYISGHTYIDVFGLNDKIVARMPGPMFGKAPTDYLLARDPDFMVLAGDGAIPPPGRFGYDYAAALYQDARFRSRYVEVYAADGFALFCRLKSADAAAGCRLPVAST